ncbi:MAG: SulP family inorganic anion transporter [Spirulina sp. SIO3F2]|nr:SulP family inorganic anion transporter [Spirulina sp. SIO3F2]
MNAIFSQKNDTQKTLSSLAIGFSLGIMSILTPGLTMAIMLFSEHLSSDYLVLGIKSVLLSSVIAGFVISLGSSLKGMLGNVSLEPVLATSVAVVVQAISPEARESEIFLTIIAVLSIASIIKGILYFSVGKFKLANFITNFVPQPIMAGFVTGLGLLFVRSALRLSTNIDLGWSTLSQLSEPGILLKLSVTLVFGFTLWSILKFYQHFLILPLFVVGGVGLFYLALSLTQTPVSAAFDGGWLLGPFPESSVSQSVHWQDVTQIRWPVILQELPNLIAFMMIDVFLFAISAGIIEKVSKETVDVNHELKINGIANLINSFSGGTIVSPSSYTFTTQKLGLKNRLVGISFTIPKIIFLFANIAFLSFFPKVVVAGIFTYLGLSLLIDNLYEEWFRVSKLEYLLMLMIAISIASGNLLEGVVIGVIRSSIIFAIQASQITPIYKYGALSSQDSPSLNVQLQAESTTTGVENIHCLELEGLIFFGNMNKLFKKLDHCLSQDSLHQEQYLILDFTRVRFLDSSLTEKLLKFQRSIQGKNIFLLFTALNSKQKQQLSRVGIIEKDESSQMVFATIDQGLGWCRKRYLSTPRRET